jgi:hypothetical protein
LADRNNHFYVADSNSNVKLPPAAFDTLNRFMLCNSPSLTVVVDAANVRDSFVGVRSIGFVDAEYLIAHRPSLLR